MFMAIAFLESGSSGTEYNEILKIAVNQSIQSHTHKETAFFSGTWS